MAAPTNSPGPGGAVAGGNVLIGPGGNVGGGVSAGGTVTEVGMGAVGMGTTSNRFRALGWAQMVYDASEARYAAGVCVLGNTKPATN